MRLGQLISNFTPRNVDIFHIEDDELERAIDIATGLL